MKLLDIYARKKQDIERIERALEEVVRSDHVMLNDASLHLLKAGGKRIRPVFVLLAGEFGDNDPEPLTKVAVSLELIHMGSLVHDDVIDDAEIRRGQSTVKAKWDNRIAMYTGDYIFAKALMVITDLHNPLIHQQLSKAMVEMCIGEMEQIRMFFRTDQSVRDYLLRIRRKTALLIASSCHMGALAAGVPHRQCQALYSFGYNVGMAFQIRDDILDLIGTEQELGKPPGSDIRQGNITLPVIYALQDPAIRPKLLEQIEAIRSAEGNADIADFLELVRRSAGIDRAEELADRFIAKAIRNLEALPDIPARRNLHDIARFIGKRKY
jgi:heptaprenyl diphosphate synthase